MVADELLRLAAGWMMWERRTVAGGWKGSMAAGCGVVRGCAMGSWVPSRVLGSALWTSHTWQRDASRGWALWSLQCFTTLRNSSGTVISDTGTGLWLGDGPQEGGMTDNPHSPSQPDQSSSPWQIAGSCWDGCS